MNILTSRFGQIAADKEDIINFEEGLLGFTNLREFVLLDDPNDEVFAWLQSCENAEIAFPVLEPELFTEPGYSIQLSKSDLEALKISEESTTRSFTIITIPDDPTKMTANLKAPVVINIQTRQARQCVLKDNHLAISEPIFTKLQQRVVQNPNISIKGESLDDVAIKIPLLDETPLKEL